jgi:hypothetical protein
LYAKKRSLILRKDLYDEVSPAFITTSIEKKSRYPLWRDGVVKRGHRILLIVGATLIAAGLVASTWALVPYEETITRTIVPTEPELSSESGIGHWILMSFSSWFGGVFSGTLTTNLSIVLFNLNWTALSWSMYSQAGLDSFKEQGSFSDGVFGAEANSTVTGIHLTSSGRYYVILEYGYGLQKPFTVTLQCKVVGLKLSSFVPGVALLWAGCLVLFCASKWKKEWKKTKGLEPISSDRPRTR